MARFHLIRPVDESKPIWRYMDFPKFMSLLLKKSLYFHPAILLRKSEPFEFRIPVKTMSISRKRLSLELINEGETQESAEELAKEWTSQEPSLYRWAVNCWTYNSFESNALWRTFVASNEGVAIKSSVKRLKDSLKKCPLIYAGLVDYIDYESEEFKPNENAIGFEQIFHKAKFYEYEREFRIVTMPKYLPDQLLNEDAFSNEATKDSLFLDVDLEVLIDEIRVSPYASPWFVELVNEIRKNNFDNLFEVTASAMKSQDIFD